MLAIGTCFQAVATWFWSLNLAGKLAHVDLDAAVTGRNFPADLAIAADAQDLISYLLKGGAKPRIAPDFQCLAQNVKQQMPADLEDRIGPFHQSICMPDRRNRSRRHTAFVDSFRRQNFRRGGGRQYHGFDDDGANAVHAPCPVLGAILPFTLLTC